MNGLGLAPLQCAGHQNAHAHDCRERHRRVLAEYGGQMKFPIAVPILGLHDQRGDCGRICKEWARPPDISKGRTDNFDMACLRKRTGPVVSGQGSWRGVDDRRFHRSRWRTLFPTDRERPFLTEPGKTPSPIYGLGSIYALVHHVRS